MVIAIVHGEVAADACKDEQDVLVQVDCVSQGLRTLGYEPTALPISLNLQEAAQRLTELRPAMAFNLVESLAGRGSLVHVVPALLDTLKIPYTGAGTAAMMLTSNKVLAKRWLGAAGLPTPPWFTPAGAPELHGAVRIEGPWLVKSVWEHASIGLDEDSVMPDANREKLLQEMEKRRGFLGGDCLAEAFIDGRESNLSILAGGAGAKDGVAEAVGAVAGAGGTVAGAGRAADGAAGTATGERAGTAAIGSATGGAADWSAAEAGTGAVETVGTVGTAAKRRTAAVERTVAGTAVGESEAVGALRAGTAGKVGAVAGATARGNHPEVLPPAEIRFDAYPPGKVRVVGYRSKWEEGSFEFDNTPRSFAFPEADAALLARLRELALKCWALFDLRGYARVDFRVDRGGRPWILEVNANPCLSPDAGFAAATRRAGLSASEVLRRIISDIPP